MAKKAINILGIRGIPAAHGGFETFVGRLAPFLRDRGWKVTVFCQHDPEELDRPEHGFEDWYEGIRRIHLRSNSNGPHGTIHFDFSATKYVLNQDGIDLVLGYNTAIFMLLQRLRRRAIAINMDGIEWKRAKWSGLAKSWFYLNELLGSRLGNVTIADHPEIASHLSRHGRNGLVTIPYGADRVVNGDTAYATALGLEPDRYMISIARIEPENSILEIVRGFGRNRAGRKLAVLGKLTDEHPYHKQIRADAGPDVIFPGPIYDSETVSSLRFNARAYIHGHQVGGTNPSLVESLGAGNAIIAHDNKFNRWTAGSGQLFFSDEFSCAEQISRLFADDLLADQARASARDRFAGTFEWEQVLGQYDDVLCGMLRNR